MGGDVCAAERQAADLAEALAGGARPSGFLGGVQAFFSWFGGRFVGFFVGILVGLAVGL